MPARWSVTAGPEHEKHFQEKLNIEHQLEHVVMQLVSHIDADAFTSLLSAAEAMQPPFEPARELVEAARQKMVEVERFQARRRKQAALEALSHFENAPPF